MGKAKADKNANRKNSEKQKSRALKKKSVQVADKIVRTKIANGELAKDEMQRNTQRDARTLYIRFSKDNAPSSPDVVKKLHSDIKFVRTPRLNVKKGSKTSINYAFVEFANESECEAAKKRLATTQFQGTEIFVDFVGEKSRTKKSRDSKDTFQFNPTRLFISNLAKGVTKTNLKEMFPKCSHADIPQAARKKGTGYGFIQFSSPSDAKAAFDAAQNLEVAGHPITVLFAKRSAEKRDVVNKKAEKRKAKHEEKKLGEPKVKKEKKSVEVENDKDESEDKEAEQVKNDKDESDDDKNDEDEADTEKEESDDETKPGEDNDESDDDENDEDEDDTEKEESDDETKPGPGEDNDDSEDDETK